MTTATLPVDELREKALTARPARVLLTALCAVFAFLGWLAGRLITIAGWLAGRAWLILAYMAEAAVYGFKAGSTLRSAPGSSGRPEQGSP